MDGTILDLEFDNYFWRKYLPRIYADKNELTLQQSKTFLANSYSRIEGKLNWYCLDFWSEQLKLDIAQLKYDIRERVAFRPGAIEFLKFLQQQNKQVLLVTNAHRKSLEIKLLSVKFHQYFDELTSSHDFGYPKEEQMYWKKLHKAYNFELDKTLFIDDSVKILTAAETFGIKYLYGISQPDLSQNEIDCSPFDAIKDFSRFISAT